MDFSSLSEYLPVFGRAHPMLLHVPIGMLVGLGVLELVSVFRRQEAEPRLLVFVAAAAAVLTAASGWVLHEEAGYAGGDTMEWHERLGIATAGCAVLCFGLRVFGSERAYRFMLLITIGVVVPAGHLGAEMTHGKGFLLEPLEKPSTEGPVLPDLAALVGSEEGPPLVSFANHVAPLLKARCHSCHGPRKSKGKLRLDSIAAIQAGGENGPVLAGSVNGGGTNGPALAGSVNDGVAKTQAAESELLRRLLLPLDHEDHMPPEQKTQPSPAEIELLRAWVLAGAPFDQGFEFAGNATSSSDAIAESGRPEDQAESESSAARSPAPATALAALRERLVHVQPTAAGSTELWVDFAAPAADIDDDAVSELLTPVIDFVAELSLARTRISDASLELIATMPALTRLDLRQTAVGNIGLAHLRGHASLSELVLSRTQVSDAASATLSEMPELKRLWIWDAQLSADGLIALREALPEVHIDAGDLANATALESEGELAFTSDAGPVDSPGEGDPVTSSEETIPSSPTALTPINSVCPVSGKPVDPKFSVVHEGRVIGFCCPNCPKSFWDDPAAFLAKLDASDPSGG